MAGIVAVGGVSMFMAGAMGLKAMSDYQHMRSGACEVARADVFMVNNNVLARQGEGIPSMPEGERAKIEKQKAAGIRGGVKRDGPTFLEKVPSKPVAGDPRMKYMGIGKQGTNPFNTQGNLTDILAKVPTKAHGASAEYQASVRPEPRRI
eukprot:CAMPEP_0184699036 /NCGR_PEP_ID=MMETSP0313-20130426/5447_1 /TAXON_ID=2792 /ORGANISM="Porphyridium aerugineum, Strain SAG 1380-2" /LENGTH=149 /DNA_ID=CAMNT_0027158059 /DNA_START=55 /DNA_END=504 /DNA_ORIENTATION=-